MTERKDNSSLPLLLSITGAVLVVAVGGWFYLGQEEAAPPQPAPAPITAPAEPVAALEEDESLDYIESADDEELPVDVVATPVAGSSPDTDAELRKARLAADADILVLPVEQSALHYYGRVLDANPDNAVAAAELDAILTRVEQTVTQHLEAEEYDAAYEIAVLVAGVRPDHSLVVQAQQTLDDYTQGLVERAIQFAQDGKDAQADELLAAARSLPGRNPDYFVAIRDSITEIRDARRAAERDKAQRRRVAADQARAAWIESVRSAIVLGNLIKPAGASARDLLAENNPWSAERSQLTGELLAALADAATADINAGRLDEVAPLLDAAGELGADAQTVNELRATLERALIDAESNRIAQIRELVQVKSAAVRYPRRAVRQNLSGWVDVIFTVTPNGKTADIQVNNAEPADVFDDAAIAAVQNWEFEPVQYRGQVISKRAGTRIVFRLE